VKLCFASWNLNWRGNWSEERTALIRESGCQLLALQEVTDSVYAAIKGSGLFDWSAFSLDHRPAGADERARGLGCAIFGKFKAAMKQDYEFRLLKSRLLKKVPLPERTLIVDVATRQGPLLTVCSFHVPDWQGWGEAKPMTQRRLTRWLGKHPQQTLVGMDVNGPKTDHPNPELCEYYFAEEWDLLAPGKSHNLRDVLRARLTANPSLHKAARTARPDGPLEVSHYTEATARRYDHIYATPDFAVTNVRYLFDEAIAAKSDHALVVADLDLAGY
jgi:endonuclease/exonuclease/phosphatase family metal-dependent hydrolase